MNIDSLKDTYQGWKLYRYIDCDLLGELSSGGSSQVHAERIYAYARYYSRGRITVNAWYYPTFDPYGEYPYEIQFFFATRDGEILKEVSIFEPDADAQLRTITESLDDLEAFFWKRLSMKLSDIFPLLGSKTEFPVSEQPMPSESPVSGHDTMIRATETDALMAKTPKKAAASSDATEKSDPSKDSKLRIRKFLGSR